MIRKQFDREPLGFWLSVIGGLLAMVGFLFPAYSFGAISRSGWFLSFGFLFDIIAFHLVFDLQFICLVLGGLLAAVLTCRWVGLGHPLRSLLTPVVGLGLLVISFCVAPLLYDVRPTPSEVASQVLLAFTKPGCWPTIAGFVIAIVGGWLLLQAEHVRQTSLPETPDSPLIDG